jgi:hypothetical protein
MITLARAIVRCYPRSWRERYGAELRALLVDVPPRARDLLDLAMGCAGVWLHRTELGEAVEGLGRFVAAMVVLVGPAFLLGRGLRLAGWSPGSGAAAVASFGSCAIYGRFAWRNRHAFGGWSRTQAVAPFGARETIVWRTVAFACAALFYSSDPSMRPIHSTIDVFMLVFAPAAMASWMVDGLALQPWFLRRPIPRGSPRPPARPLGLNADQPTNSEP